jgi:hypothetical protein
MKIKELTSDIGKVYIDLDGVVAYCDKGIADFNNIAVEETLAAGFDNKYWKNVIKNANIKDFYANLEWEPNGKKLLKWFEDRDIPITFLTRPTKAPTTKDCIEGKKIWLKNNNLDSIPVLFEFNKEKYAISGDKVNILVDDQQKNIDKWNEAGGIGLLYKNGNFSTIIKELGKIYENQ